MLVIKGLVSVLSPLQKKKKRMKNAQTVCALNCLPVYMVWFWCNSREGMVCLCKIIQRENNGISGTIKQSNNACHGVPGRCDNCIGKNSNLALILVSEENWNSIVVSTVFNCYSYEPFKWSEASREANPYNIVQASDSATSPWRAGRPWSD